MLIVTLGGCSMTKKFTNEEEAKQYVLEELNKKYNVEFVYDEKQDQSSYGKYPIKDAFTGVFYPKTEPEKTTSVWTSSKGELKDDYAQYYFKDEAEQKVKNTLKEFSIIKSCNVELEAGNTSETLYDSLTLEEYIQQTNSSYRIELSFPEKLTDEEYATEIQKIVEQLNEQISNYNLKVTVSQKTLFFITVNPNIKELTKESILEEFASQRRIDKLNEQDQSGDDSN